MEHLILRCKHCHKEYTYCTYGNGPEFGTEEGCSREYCAECQKAIDEALSKIPEKFEPRYMEIKDKRIFEMLERVKKNYEEDRKVNPSVGIITNPVMWTDFDVVETYEHDRTKYKVEWNNDTPDDKHVSIYAEYDLTQGQFTGKTWRDGIGVGDNYYHYEKPDWMRTGWLSKSDLEAVHMESFKLSKPVGEVFYFEPVMEDSHEEKSEHIKIIVYPEYDGRSLKKGIEDGTIKCDPSLDTSNIDDILSYTCTREEYNDEDEGTIIDIKVS